MAKFTLCYLNKGMYNGRQVIPRWFAEDAVKPLVDNSPNEPEIGDSSNGYGYCFWHNYHVENSSRADGMFSQFGILMPDYDAALIFTDGHPDEQYVRDCIWRHFLHEGMGFRRLGVYRHTGYKCGAWHDVAWFEREILPCSGEPAPFTPIGQIPLAKLEEVLRRYSD